MESLTDINDVEAHEEALRSILGFLSECDEKGRTILKIPLEDEVFGTRHNPDYVSVCRCREWFEKITKNEDDKGWIFEWHVNLWASYLHEFIKPSNPRRIQFVCSSILSLNSAANETRIDTFFEVLKQNPARIYVCPYLRNHHWLLLLVIPEAFKVYCIYSQGQGLRDECLTFVKSVTKLYDTLVRNDGSEDRDWNIANIAHKKQAGKWECGYYVMLYMEKVALETEGIDILTHFPDDDDDGGEFSREKMDGVVRRLCCLFVQKVIPFDHAILETNLDREDQMNMDVETTEGVTASIIYFATSVNTSVYLLKSAADQILPAAFKTSLTSLFRRLFKRFSSDVTITIQEYDDLIYNHRFAAANTYLSAKLSPLTRRIKVSQPVKEVERDVITVDKDEEIIDSFDGILFRWLLKSKTVTTPGDSQKAPITKEERSFELAFHSNHLDTVLKSYFPHITRVSNRIQEESKVVKLHTYGSCPDTGASVWRSVALTHPSNFETIAMEPEAKAELIKDLDKFKNRKDYYKKVGKVWKRGYLLYGPPGTGKSSLVAAMADYLKYDIYDLDLRSLYRNSQLLELLVRFKNKSILVIEDIDCSGINVSRANEAAAAASRRYDEITMSGLLNFIDGLWTSCGEERIVVFTTNHKERLDPALLRPGRMDVHIEMSYCKFGSFKTLARNYLDLEDHQLFGEIEVHLSEVEVSPADGAGQLLKGDDPNDALQILIKFLTDKKKLKFVTPQEDEKTPELQPPNPNQAPQKQEEKETPESEVIET